MRFEDYITISPDVRSGMTEAQILADFPALKSEHIRACLAFAAARERRLASGSAA
jgi:uncharacterized protein (DUF433 family)